MGPGLGGGRLSRHGWWPTLAILTVAGATAWARLEGRPGLAAGPMRLHVGPARRCAGRRARGAVLLAFGLAALAPACYAVVRRSRVTLQRRLSRGSARQRVDALWPRAAGLAAWSSARTRLERMLRRLQRRRAGSSRRPRAGRMAADYVPFPGVWPGRPAAYNVPRAARLGVRAVAGLATARRAVGRLLGWPRSQPAPVLALPAAFRHLPASRRSRAAESELEAAVRSPRPARRRPRLPTR